MDFMSYIWLAVLVQPLIFIAIFNVQILQTEGKTRINQKIAWLGNAEPLDKGCYTKNAPDNFVVFQVHHQLGFSSTKR